ncbi:MAG: hypothetical protein E7K90_02985 [Hafnia alvei]|uniref:hypothetical protein n=1 Tax=Hafnia alvei TaxID=569 RepID=UPI00290DFC26|nr:hypothetical protein [Hafnia alvei]MDU7480346.1 hypothetical protein [Hafnia alvei]
MTKLTTERLEEIAKLEITEFSNGMDIAKDAYQSVGSSEIVLMARQLLAYEQAAKNPIGSFHISGGQVEATTDYCRDGEWPVQDGEVLVYAVPVLPKQPELIGMKVSIDTGSDNIGHRLFGEIVGTSDSNGVPVLCIEVAENNGDMAAPAQPVTPEQPEPTISFYRDGIIAAAKWVENQRDAYDNEHGQSDPDTGAFEFGNDAQLEYSTTLSEIAEGIRSLHPASAKPVSEPYKLEIDMDDADHFSVTHLHEIIYGKELIWPEAKLLARFMLDVKQRVSEAPAQESE